MSEAEREITVIAMDGKVSFDPEVPQIRRGRSFKVKANNAGWDGTIKMVELKNFQSFTFNHGWGKWTKSGDSYSADIKIELDANGHPKVIQGNHNHFFPTVQDQGNLDNWEHRLIEYDLVVKTADDAVVVVDPAWDEKP